MGTVEMKTPAMGMKLQMKTNSPSRPIPGIWRIHMPNVVRAVLAIAICACIDKLFLLIYSIIHTFILLSFTHSFDCCSRMHSFVVCSFIQSFLPFKFSFIRSFNHPSCLDLFAVHSLICLFTRFILPSFVHVFIHSPTHPCSHTSIMASLGEQGPDPNCDPTCMCLAHTTMLYHLTLQDLAKGFTVTESEFSF